MEILAEYRTVLLMAPKIMHCVKEMIIKTITSVKARVTVTEVHN
jgi:hypothetical protein